jgi:hypothetical protein
VSERTSATESAAASADERAKQRDVLLVEHRAARAKRDAAALGSAEFRAAAEEIARIEVAINRLEEPDPAA